MKKKSVNGVSCTCGDRAISVVDSRFRVNPINDEDTIQRTRVCAGCGNKFKTLEIPNQLLEEILEGANEKIQAARDAKTELEIIALKIGGLL